MWPGGGTRYRAKTRHRPATRERAETRHRAAAPGRRHRAAEHRARPARPRIVTELRRILPFLLLPLALILAGCGILSTATSAPPEATAPPASPTPSIDPVASPDLTPIPGVTGDIGSAHEAWVASGVTSYTWQVRYSCFCPDTGALTVVVRDGTVVSVTREDGTAADDRATAFPLTIEGLYADLADTIARGGSVTGTFDAAGVPSRLSVDRIKNAADDEYGVEVLSFSPAA